MQAQGPPPSARLRSAGWAAAILGLVLACYWPALGGGLVWDDASHVTRPDLRSWEGLSRIWLSFRATEQYYPVLHSAFWLEHRLWGDSALGYHLANVALHSLDCLLFMAALVRLGALREAVGPADGTGARPGPLPAGAAALAAALFAVHPVCVESVAWIAEQKNTLSLAFYLLAGLAYLDYREGGRLRAYLLASGLFALALGTKSVTSSLPAALLVALWWATGRVSWRRDGTALLPWFAAALAAGLSTAWIERTVIGASGARFAFSAGQRVLLASRDAWFYLGKLAWPRTLLFFYPRWDVALESRGWYGYLAASVALTAALWLLRRRHRGPLAAWLFFVGSLFPALGFFNVYPFLFSYVADHFQYAASLGVLSAAAIGFSAAVARAARPVRAAGWGLACLAVAALALKSNAQSREYRGAESLYRAILAGNPACWKAHTLLGDELLAGPARPGEALEEFGKAVELEPEDAEAQNNLGSLLLRVPGRRADAIEHLGLAARYGPYMAEPHLNLADAWSTTPGRAADAVAEYREALRINPNLVAAHYGLANTLSGVPGGEAGAIAEYGRALQLDPGNVPARVNLAGELERVPGREAEALEEYARVLRAHPDLAPVHYDLAIALSRLPGRADDAIAEYLEALRIDPRFADAHKNLGVEYARKGRMDEAELHWRRALELDPGFSDVRAMLRSIEQARAR
ncbi:MAG: tetratricopeptide repeat protein [Opitutaceae bacterium]|jgi:tetratricopeptide (TPR) repeat protein